KTFTAAFFAFLLFKANMTVFVIHIAGAAPAVLLFILISVLFASAVLLNKFVTARVSPFLSVFFFPLFWSGIEFILGLVLPDGTYASTVAYSQADNINLIQIASVT